MGKLRIFQYAILIHPREKSGLKSIMLDEPKTILALDDKQAAMLIARQIPEEHLDNLENIEVIVRPF